MPDIFVQFCQSFHQDILVFYPNSESAAKAFVNELNSNQKHQLHDYIEVLLGVKNESQLSDLWHSCGAGVYITPMGPFFEFVQKALL